MISKKQIGEDIQSAYESKGRVFIRKIIDGECSFYSNENDRIEFFFYIAMQYVRTKNIRESLVKVFSNFDEYSIKMERNVDAVVEHAKKNKIEINAELAKEQVKNLSDNLNLYNTMAYTAISSANELAYAFSVANKLSLTILHAPSGPKFITGDQPVINLKQNERDEQGNVLEVVLYYPLSQDIAILLKKDTEHRVYEENITLEKIRELNGFVFDNSFEQVYASSEEELLSLM
ncbi:DUF4238 domain-containing protein [Rahnella sp. C60]|uniref:DUF4238 domain-containing protein n=1 Tax=Rahnella perminowiae TaxID=2816244 RepID=UPI001C268A3D|nr:DUF4238 domain-containing protein [Rahnella perminowiae]MBU9813495.1 DUF4238 domain-containing protein [Rahnella perminowiae]MCX2944378.1 DUF4238 domain-containing protein [Rahnella perminowiae]